MVSRWSVVVRWWSVWGWMVMMKPVGYNGIVVMVMVMIVIVITVAAMGSRLTVM